MNRVFYALDTPDLTAADLLIANLKDAIGGIKLGLEFFLAHGADGYRKLAVHRLPIFLDLKLHDIPNTVHGAISSLLPLQPDFITVHAGGGGVMMRAAVAAAATSELKRPKILAVTVLTSLDSGDLSSVGQERNLSDQVLRLAKLAKDSGADGAICSPNEIHVLREALGEEFILMVPGIRPTWARADDQKRFLTPREACQLGATYLVIGRPITTAADPKVAAERIQKELS